MRTLKPPRISFTLRYDQIQFYNAPLYFPDWRQLLKEGYELEKSIKTGNSRFLKDTAYKTYHEYKEACKKDGKIRYKRTDIEQFLEKRYYRALDY